MFGENIMEQGYFVVWDTGGVFYEVCEEKVFSIRDKRPELGDKFHFNCAGTLGSGCDECLYLERHYQVIDILEMNEQNKERIEKLKKKLKQQDI
jgi:hypothetical protein